MDSSLFSWKASNISGYAYIYVIATLISNTNSKNKYSNIWRHILLNHEEILTHENHSGYRENEKVSLREVHVGSMEVNIPLPKWILDNVLTYYFSLS